jgi:hypothetical protein
VNLRERYFIRFEKVLKPYTKVVEAWRHQQHESRREYMKENPETYNNRGWYTNESMDEWFLEKHNIVVSRNAGGIIKLGFASPADVTLFTLRNS